MKDPFGILIRRIYDKDPLLTPQELEKEIAYCFGEKMNNLIKQTIADGPIELLRQALKEALGLSCEVIPALSLYVKVSSALCSETPIEDFSSLQFEKALSVIAEKNFSAMPSEKILHLINKIINQASESFIHNVLLSHPLLMKIFRQFQEIFHEQIAIMLCDPIMIFLESAYGQKKDKDENGSRPGMYL